MNYISGTMVKELREQRKLTQKDLAEKLRISDKTISKWETGKGLPDITLVTPLAEALGISVAELFAGEYAINDNRAGNVKKLKFYVCPICGNIITTFGEGDYNCCGVKLPVLTVEEASFEHQINYDMIEHEFFVHIDHPMTKEHYISFIAYVTADRYTLVKLYPEQEAQCRFLSRGHGFIYAYCNRDGLFRITV